MFELSKENKKLVPAFRKEIKSHFTSSDKVVDFDFYELGTERDLYASIVVVSKSHIVAKHLIMYDKTISPFHFTYIKCTGCL